MALDVYLRVLITSSRYSACRAQRGLAATHRAGFGRRSVFDGARGDTARQLERAGLRVLDGAAPPADAVLIVVTAPGRTASGSTFPSDSAPCQCTWPHGVAMTSRLSGPGGDAAGHSHRRRWDGFRDLTWVLSLAARCGVAVPSVCPDPIESRTS